MDANVLKFIGLEKLDIFITIHNGNATATIGFRANQTVSISIKTMYGMFVVCKG